MKTIALNLKLPKINHENSKKMLNFLEFKNSLNS